jgi:hypothetical protein
MAAIGTKFILTKIKLSDHGVIRVSEVKQSLISHGTNMSNGVLK